MRTADGRLPNRHLWEERNTRLSSTTRVLGPMMVPRHGMTISRHVAEVAIQSLKARGFFMPTGMPGRVAIHRDRFVHGRTLFVACAMRGEVVRIIPTGGAEPHNKRKCHEV